MADDGARNATWPGVHTGDAQLYSHGVLSNIHSAANCQSDAKELA